jgi:hypothetical protein
LFYHRFKNVLSSGTEEQQEDALDYLGDMYPKEYMALYEEFLLLFIGTDTRVFQENWYIFHKGESYQRFFFMMDQWFGLFELLAQYVPDTKTSPYEELEKILHWHDLYKVSNIGTFNVYTREGKLLVNITNSEIESGVACQKIIRAMKGK